MKLTTLLAGVVTPLVLAAAALAVTPPGADRANAARDCAAIRSSLGSATFKLTYGTNADRSNAFGMCVSRFTPLEQQDRLNASRQCTTEQNDPNFPASHDGKTFDQFYGGNGNDKNAFGKCVSQKARAMALQQQQAVENAARACKRERAADPAAFKAKYGTNANKSNAFGKCVSAKAKAQNG
jgi:hypothetical protein